MYLATYTYELRNGIRKPLYSDFKKTKEEALQFISTLEKHPQAYNIRLFKQV